QHVIDVARDAVKALATLDKAEGTDADKRDRRRALQEQIDAGEGVIAAIRARRISRRKYSVSSGNAGKIRGMLDQALPHRCVDIDELDHGKLLLNVGNGTLHFIYEEKPDPDAGDHSTATIKRWRVELRAHDRADNIAKLAPVDYDPKARAPRFIAS